ncbi:hypothetical protein F4703DRAFT_1483090 [Phycomyces blakesleeanus]
MYVRLSAWLSVCMYISFSLMETAKQVKKKKKKKKVQPNLAQAQPHPACPWFLSLSLIPSAWRRTIYCSCALRGCFARCVLCVTFDFYSRLVVFHLSHFSLFLSLSCSLFLFIFVCTQICTCACVYVYIYSGAYVYACTCSSLLIFLILFEYMHLYINKRKIFTINIHEIIRLLEIINIRVFEFDL